MVTMITMIMVIVMIMMMLTIMIKNKELEMKPWDSQEVQRVQHSLCEKEKVRILILLVEINFLVSKKAIALVVILIQITNLEHYTRVHGDEVSDGGVHRNGGAHEVEDVFLLGDRVLDAFHLGEHWTVEKIFS